MFAKMQLDFNLQRISTGDIRAVTGELSNKNNKIN